MIHLLETKAGTFGPAWHARGAIQDPVAAVCVYCDRSIAIERADKDLNAGCVYCGLDRGELPDIDSPIGEWNSQ